MKCYADGKVCTCNLDDVGDCPRDPFRDAPDTDEEYDLLKYLNGDDSEARSVHG